MLKGRAARIWAAGAAVFAALALSAGAEAQQANMTFFVTSTGPGKGADFGGLSGADAHCQSLAQGVGAGSRTWRAYLSTSAAGGSAAVNAKRSHRLRSLAECEGRSDRQGCRRPAWAQQQPHQADGTHREGRGHQRPRRHPQHARRPRQARSPTAPPSPARTTRPAATGPRAGKVPPSLDITTARAWTTVPRPSRGTPRTARVGAAWTR